VAPVPIATEREDTDELSVVCNGLKRIQKQQREEGFTFLEKGSSMFLRNFCMHLLDYTVS
jgi:hypothetical protein